MQPEISRRCLSCGAAVRAGSRFCPHCGKPLEAEAAVPETREAEAVREASAPPTNERAAPATETAPAREPPPTKDWTPPTKEFTVFEQPSGGDGGRAAEHAADIGAVHAAGGEVGAPVAYEPQPPGEARRAGVDPGDAAGAAAEAGRGRVARVREGTRARVERMREEAIVVLEETPDDSGLRFVIVAAALFVVFLVLLFLSTTILR